MYNKYSIIPVDFNYIDCSFVYEYKINTVLKIIYNGNIYFCIDIKTQ